MSDSFMIPWTLACQAPLYMGFPRQEYWSGLPFPTPEDFPKQGNKPKSPELACGFFTAEIPGKPSPWFGGMEIHYIAMNFKPLMQRWAR